MSNPQGENSWQLDEPAGACRPGRTRRTALINALLLVVLVGATIWWLTSVRSTPARPAAPALSLTSEASARPVRGEPALATPQPTPTRPGQPSANQLTPVLAETQASPPTPTLSAASAPILSQSTPVTTPTPRLDRRPAGPAATPSSSPGERPLPPGGDLSLGPTLREASRRGAAGLIPGDGGLADLLVAAYRAALLAEEMALSRASPVGLDVAFTGPALDDLLTRLERAQYAGNPLQAVEQRASRIMPFIEQLPGPTPAYRLTDARTVTTTLYRVARTGERGERLTSLPPVRVCAVTELVLEDGRWKVRAVNREEGGLVGNHCPPGWS